MDGALTPSASRDRALARSFGALLLLGAHHATSEWAPAFALWSVGRDAGWVRLPSLALLALHGLAIVLIVSRRPQVAALGACATLAALYAAVPATYHNNHYLLFLALLLVALVPVDLARAVRWQLSLVYVASALVKLTHPWWRGSGAVLRWLATTRAPEANPDALVPRALAPLLSRPLPSRLADVATIALELALPFALAAPRTRGAALVVGTLLHVSMQEWLFPQLFTFLVLAGYFAWSPADDRAWTLSLDPAQWPRLARLVPALDLLHRVRRVDAGSAAVVLVGPSGARFAGWRAIPHLALLTPVTVVVYAAIALVAPDLHAIGPLGRDAVENVAVGLALLALAASVIPGPGRRAPWEKTLPPR